MSRFVKIGSASVSVDKIKEYWKSYTDEHTVLNVELEDGEILKDTYPITENYIEGWEHIVQVIPCIKPLYQRYRDVSGEICEAPIYYLGLCASGYVRPLEVCGCDGVIFADDASNYLGLYDKSMKDEDKEIE